MSCNDIRDTLDAIHTMVKRIQATLNTRLRATLPPPDGIETQNHGGGWWYLTWKAVPGAGGYQQEHPDTGLGPTPGNRTSIFAVATGDTRVIKIRSVGGDTVSAWAKCTVWWDGRLKVEIEGGGEPPPPEPPAVPTVSKVTAGHTSIAAWWSSPDNPQQWEARLVDQLGEHVAGQNSVDPTAIFNVLQVDTTYGFEVRSVGSTGLRSEWSPTWWIKTLEDGQRPKPDAPTGLRVHCITETGAKAEWDGDTDADGWTVSLPGHDDEGDFTQSTLVRLAELEPDTTYTVQVVEHLAEEVSDPATATFTTQPAADEPEPPPDPGPQLPDITGLYSRPVDGGRGIEATWDRGSGVDFWLVCLGDNRWRRVNNPIARWDGTEPGSQHTIEAQAVQQNNTSHRGTKLSRVARTSVLTQRVEVG